MPRTPSSARPSMTDGGYRPRGRSRRRRCSIVGERADRGRRPRRPRPLVGGQLGVGEERRRRGTRPGRGPWRNPTASGPRTAAPRPAGPAAHVRGRPAAMQPRGRRRKQPCRPPCRAFGMSVRRSSHRPARSIAPGSRRNSSPISARRKTTPTLPDARHRRPSVAQLRPGPERLPIAAPETRRPCPASTTARHPGRS